MMSLLLEFEFICDWQQTQAKVAPFGRQTINIFRNE